jgi:hypothetical protein
MMGIMRDEDISPIQRYFYIWDIDPESGLAIEEVCCGLANAALIADLLGVSLSKINSSNFIDMDNESIDKINKFFSILVEIKPDAEIVLCSWSPLDGVPYRLHTRRELVLMVSGRKPMCSLIGRIPPDESFDEIPEYLFDPYVFNGKFLKKEYCEINHFQFSSVKGVRVVLYAIASEAWRLDAYTHVRLTAKKFGWNESLTYQEGSLLGYSEPENDAWIEISRRQLK